MNRLGLIAGNGVFPLEVAVAARRRGIAVIAIAHQGETIPELAPACDEITWIRVGEIQRIMDVLHAAAVDHAAMAGGIARARLGESFAPDARAISMITRIGRLSDDAVLRALAAEIEAEGIPVIDPVPFMDDAVAGPGRLAGPEPPADKMADLELAFAVMRALGDFDIGQAVAIHRGVVVAVEAVEGTDAALRRAASLCGRGMVVAKAAKRGQDMRFDRPAIGPGTIELLAELGAAMLAVADGEALVLERARTFALADSAGITIYGH